MNGSRKTNLNNDDLCQIVGQIFDNIGKKFDIHDENSVSSLEFSLLILDDIVPLAYLSVVPKFDAKTTTISPCSNVKRKEFISLFFIN